MKSVNRIITASAVAAVSAGALLMPAAAQAAPAHAENATPSNSACTVTAGDLKWGVKESFRSYISGSIANGSWETADGATYATPLFGWSTPTGEVDATTGEGTISFPGSVHFTGHGGVLNLTLSNPSIVLNGDGTGQLLMDTKSNNAKGELVIDEQQAYLGKLEGITNIDPASGAVAISDAPAVLTSDGATAFGGYYASGDDLDPVSVTLQFAQCEGSPAAAQPTTTETPTPIAEDAKSEVPWVPIAVGGAALAVIGVTAGMLVAGRKKGGAA